MFILSQNREDIVNLDNVVFIGTNYENNIIAWFEDDDFTIGKYGTEEEAKRVLEQILDFIAEPCNTHNRIFRMPPSTTGDDD